MKKRICILLLFAALLMLIPHAASANAPSGRRPNTLWVECRNLKHDTKIEAVLFTADGSSRTAEASFSRYKDDTAGMAYIRVEEGETSFYLLITTAEGTKRTDAAEIIEYGGYSYDGRTNLLVSTGAYYDPLTDDTQWFLRLGFLLGITLLTEWIVALCFGIHPVKYVFAANAISNPIMNVILMFVMILIRSDPVYRIALALLEIAVFFFEYWFYKRRYERNSRTRLLVFTLVANAVSLAGGILLQSLLW